MRWNPNRSPTPGRTSTTVAIVVAAVGLGAVVMAPGVDDEADHDSAPPAAMSTTTTTVSVEPLGGVLLGASTSPEVRTLAAERSAVESLEQLIGRRLDINHNFYPWNEPFPTAAERWDLEAGRLPMISWNGRDITTDAIASGQFDALIRQRARATQALAQPLLIRWFWEMDGNKKAQFAGTPDEYVDAWRHIVSVFRAEGTTNVRWVWCPNASAFNDGRAQQFYPGDEWVDWICADGYNWAPGRPGDGYRPFKDIFGGFYAWASLHGKPIMVGEFGVQERDPGEKARWITEAREVIKTDFPLLRAIVYFNSNKDYDWRLTTSSSALEAFKQLAHDPWFDLGADRDRIVS